MAVREDEIAAKAMGINTRNMKLLAFGMGATFGGVSGAMFASFQGFISPESFNLMESVMIVAMVVLGGVGYLPGVILGAVLLAALPEVLRYVAGPLQTLTGGRLDASILRQLLIALAMISVMLLHVPADCGPPLNTASPGERQGLTCALRPGLMAGRAQLIGIHYDRHSTQRIRRFKAVWWFASPERCRHQNQTRPGVWPDWPQRCRQDHLFQRTDRPLHARQRQLLNWRANLTSRLPCIRLPKRESHAQPEHPFVC